jgi:hypothetical protein
VCESIKQLAANHKTWSEEYIYDGKTNNFHHKNDSIPEKEMVKSWFR